MNFFIPNNIKTFISNKPFNIEKIGLSQSTVLIFDNMVLKIENHTSETDKTIQMFNWLSGRLPVPKIICYEIYDGKAYILMSRIKGKMTCDEQYMEQADKTVALLAEGLKLLWSVDISECPRKITFEDELTTARYYIENNMLDNEAVDFELLNKNGFENVTQLLAWLENNIPQSENVLSHGDYCMPNVMIKNGSVSGFIDIGECAVSDKWKDIASCYISLKNNFSGFFGGKVYPNFNPDILFEKLGIELNCDKLNYYILLGELFKIK